MRDAISHPLETPELQKVKKAADVLKVTHPAVLALQDPQNRERAYRMIEEDYVSGQFLIDNLGARRYIEPVIAATLLVIRQKMIEDLQIDSATGYIPMDNALTAQYNAFKLQRILGDLAIHLERGLFQVDSVNRGK